MAAVSQDSDSDNPAFIQKVLGRWQNALVLVSIPHAAAFGTALGKFEIVLNDRPREGDVISLFVFIVIIPFSTIWMFWLNDQLRSLFIRAGHSGKKLTFIHTLKYIVGVFFPLSLFFFADYFKFSSKENVLALLFLGWILFSWWFCVAYIANKLYLETVDSLE